MFETEPPYRLPLDRVIYLLRREANCGFIMEDCKIAFLQAADILEKSQFTTERWSNAIETFQFEKGENND